MDHVNITFVYQSQIDVMKDVNQFGRHFVCLTF